MVFRASQRSTSSSVSIIFPRCSLSFDGHWGQHIRPEQPRRKRPRFHIFPGSAPMRCTTLRLTTWPRVRHTFPGDTVDPGLGGSQIDVAGRLEIYEIWVLKLFDDVWCIGKLHRVTDHQASIIKPVTHVNRRGRHSLPLSSTRTLYRLVMNWWRDSARFEPQRAGCRRARRTSTRRLLVCWVRSWELDRRAVFFLLIDLVRRKSQKRCLLVESY